MRSLIPLLLIVVLSPTFALARSKPLSPEAEAAKLERARDRRPDLYERREALALARYRLARAALDRGDLETYEAELQLAREEWSAGLLLNAQNATPHSFLGLIDAYQGDIHAALERMLAARVTEPDDERTYVNIAAALTYAGRETREIEKWLARSKRKGVGPAQLEFRRCMLLWRDGDTHSAAAAFYHALELDPGIGTTWNEAPVPRPLKTFDDLAHYCCASPACGPYMAKACATAERDIAALDFPPERALRELRERMAARRREVSSAAASTVESTAESVAGPTGKRRSLEIRVTAEAPATILGQSLPAETPSAAGEAR